MIDEQKLYASAAGFEDRADEANEAKRIADYIATHVRCANGHHRAMEDKGKPCPVCQRLVPFNIEPAEVPGSLR